MQLRRPQTDSAPRLAGDQRAEIVDRLYEVALDPISLEGLVDVWERHIGPMRLGPVDQAVPLDDPELEAHVARASVFLARYEATREDGNYRSVLEDIPRSAAFLSDGGPGIVAFNRPAAIAFGLRDGAPIASLPFEADDISTLRSIIHKVATGRAERVITLRLRSTITGSPVIVRIGPVEAPHPRPLALVMSTELVWPEGFEWTVQEAFGLTSAEVEIVRGITLGLPLKDIAESRGRSTETVRTQVRSILAKTEAHSQSELVRVVLGLMDVSLMPNDPGGPLPEPGTLQPVAFAHFKTPQGRRMEWIEFGSPTGAPCLFLHQHFGFIRWPATAERSARLRGMRVIVPVRAGYGRTDPLAPGVTDLDGVVADYLSLLDHLGIRRTAILSLGADLRFAMQLSVRRPAMITGIVGCAAQLPLRHAGQYARMDKWQRCILGNARYAPGVLPFLIQAGFALARRLGKEKLLTLINAGSPADLAAFSRPEVREALLAGSEVTIAAKISAHDAFTRECLGSETDWSDVVRACPAPVILLQGDQDPQTPAETIRELACDHVHLEVRVIPGAGQLLFFAEWPMVLDTLVRFLPRR